jgi:catechol 2,3-dioxygenase-like lactoylglutathione lyase family enzyme
MTVRSLDHFVLTVVDVFRSVRFYVEALGMREVRFGDDRVALRFGECKINLHQAGAEIVPHARHATPGSADLCFIVDDDINRVAERLARLGVPIELGPVARSGALGAIRSIYLRDPDDNLIELSNYAPQGSGAAVDAIRPELC